MKLNLHTSLKHKNDDMKTSLLKKLRKLPLLATLLLFVGLTAPVTGWGQIDLTVKDDATGSNSYVPIYGLYVDDYQRSQTIYPSSLLTSMQGGTITKLTYYKNSTNPWTNAVFQVTLGTTTTSAFSNSSSSSYLTLSNSVVVYSGKLENTGQTMEIVFSTPFTYSSGNLVVDIQETTTGTYSSASFIGETASTYYSCSSYDGSAVPTSGTPRQFMPKTTFTYLPTTPYITLAPTAATILTGFNQTLTATYGNVSGTPTITYSSSNTNVATVSGSGTTATVTGVAPGTATITATMNGSYTATCAITVEDPSYCTPGTGNYDNNGISNVTFGTGPIVNNTVGGINYGDYSNLVGAVSAGATCQVDITYKTGYTYGTIIWVDWNQNYTFEGTEAVYAGTSGSDNPTTLNATFTVPATTQAGDYRMRIIGSDSDLDSYTGSLSAAANANPCGSYNYSTCHDYTLRVSSNPFIALDPSAATVLTGFTQTLTATYGNVSGTPTINYTSSNTNVATVSGSGTTATVTGVAPGTATITASMTYQGTTYTATCAITVENPSYCTPSFGSNSDCITNITLGDINNTTASSSTNGYGDYTSMSTELEPGTTATLSLTSGSGTGTHAAAVWIDFNDNYVFESSERVGTQDNISAGSTVSISLAIPSDAAVGNHRLRVVYQYSVTATNINPCASASYGEGEDYTVVITSSCPAPTNVTASNITVNSAHISWNGEADSYNVRYATATVSGTTLDPVFEDGFESGLTGWTTYANGFSGEGTTNWQTYDASGFTDGSNHGGSYSAMSRSWTSSTGDVSVDNWLVTPQMTLGNTLKFWVATNSGYPDSYAVYVSTGSGVVPSSGTGDFVVVANLTPATGTWTEKTYDLSAYAGQQGYVAIRHKDNAKDHLLVDDFGVYNTINSYTYGTFTTLPPTSETSCNITGLSPETLYVAQVQADCGSTDGTSSWVSVYFTTPDACGAPTNLVSSNITATSATLGWADNQDSYNVRYRKVYFYEDFEDETMPTGWTTIDANNDGLCWQIGSATAHSGVNGACNTSFVYDADFSLSTTPDDYLISPQLDLKGTLRVWLSGFPRNSTNYSEHFAIYISTTGNSVSNFTTTLVGETTTTNGYVEYTADLSSYAGQQGYIAIRHFNCTNQNYLYVDDFGLYGSENWVSVTPSPTDATTTLTGLTPTTDYEWQVQGINCDGANNNTDWSLTSTFTTLEAYTITATASPTAGGTVQVGSAAAGTTSSQLVNLGSDVTIVATAASGYYFVNWTNDNGGAVVATTASYTVSNVTAAASYTANFRQAPHTIANTTDWNNFAEAVSYGYDYSGETVNMTGDVSITSQANQAGANNKFFKGTFNGNCNTITVNITATGDYCAPFYAIQNATINDLVVTGTITSSYHDAAGFCGGMYGNSTFNNCVSNVAITSTRPTYSDTRSACGGFAGKSGGGDNPTFIGCAFTGSLSAISEKWGGFIGFHASRSGWSGTYNGRSTFTNCICAPTSITVNGITDNATFVSGYNQNQYLIMTVTNSYYNEEAAKLGTKQGKQAYIVAGGSSVTVAMSGNATSYTCSGIDAYSPGMVFDGEIIGGSGEVLDLALGYTGTCTLTGYTTTTGSLSGSATTGTNDAYTLTMAAANATIGVTENCVTTWVSVVTTEPSGFSLSNIDSPEDLAWVISLVNGYNGQVVDATAAKNVTITADLDMSAHTWVPIGEGGTPYLGTFDGNFHTISGLHIAADEEAAAGNKVNTGLFGLTDSDATIKNLYVKDAEFVNNNASGNLGGIVGSNGGTVQNCYSDATLGGTATNKGGIAGTNTGTLTNSYTMVTSGVAGSSSGTVNNCYSKAANDASPAAGEFTSAVDYAYGDYTTNNAVDNKPLVEWLNTSNPDNTVKWIRPKGSLKINDGYPVLVEASTDTVMAVVGVTNDKNIYKGEANAMIGAYSTNTNADIYVYGGGTLTTKPTNAHLFIDEDASVKQTAAAGDIVATVGITIDNSANNGEMGRDWHTFSTPLSNAPLGIGYTNSSPLPFNASDETVYANMGFLDAGYFNTELNSYKEDIDFYMFSEPDYHWINLKRGPDSHWHEDGDHLPIEFNQGTTIKPGAGYLLAIGDNTAANKKVYMSATGILNNATTVEDTVSASGAHLTGYNFLGNPYQSYLDFNAFANTNESVLWNSGGIGYKSYLIYDADEDGFVEYLVDNNSVGFSQGAERKVKQLLHPHQGFFVIKNTSGSGTVTFTNDMRVTNTTGLVPGSYRDAQPTYPLVNLICTDSDGKREVSVIEVDRPGMAGALKMKEMLNAKANMYVRWGSEDFSSMFIDHTPDYVPVWFKSVEEGIFTMTWSTANDNFGYLHLIDNLTGNDIDMLTTDSYAFQSRPSDSKARFRLVFSPLGIDEETTTEQGENFAFINGNELVVTGEGELSLIDLNGRVLTTEYVSGQQSHIAMPKVAVGMYMLRLANSDGVKVQKIVVRK